MVLKSSTPNGNTIDLSDIFQQIYPYQELKRKWSENYNTSVFCFAGFK